MSEFEEDLGLQLKGFKINSNKKKIDDNNTSHFRKSFRIKNSVKNPSNPSVNSNDKRFESDLDSDLGSVLNIDHNGSTDLLKSVSPIVYPPATKLNDSIKSKSNLSISNPINNNNTIAITNGHLFSTDSLLSASSVDKQNIDNSIKSTEHLTSNINKVQDNKESLLLSQDNKEEIKKKEHNIVMPDFLEIQVNDDDPTGDYNVNTENKDSDSDSDDGGWQNMETIASYNVYNKKGELEIKNYKDKLKEEEEDLFEENKKKAGFSYTKVGGESQAQRSHETNRKTDFLFNHKALGKLNNDRQLRNDIESSQSESETDFYDEYEDDVEPMNELTSDNQLSVTKTLLNDKEKLAYAGSINVLANQMCTELVQICLSMDIKSHKKLAKRLQFAQKDIANWKQDLLLRLYDHLDVPEHDVAVVEKLSLHGIELEDICKCLKTTQSVENPLTAETLNKDNDDDDDSSSNKTNDKVVSETNSVDKGTENNQSDKFSELHNVTAGDDTLNSIEQPGNDTITSETKDNDDDDYDNNTNDKKNIDTVLFDSKEKTEELTNNPFDDKNEINEEKNVDHSTVPNSVVNPENVMNKSKLDVDVAWTVICDLFLILLQRSVYDSRSRTLLIKFANVLNISKMEINEFEKRITDSLDMEQSIEEQEWNELKHMKDRRKKSRRKKMIYVGLAMVGGSLVLGLSGGLLAPVIGAGVAAGLSTIGITGASGFITGAGGTAIVAVTSTAIGANIGKKGMQRRMGSVRTFEFRPLHNNRRVNLIVTVSGWLIGAEDDIRLPFSTVDPIEGDLYSLLWEPEMLRSTGQTINIVATEVFTQAIQQVLGATILTAFMSAIQWPLALSKLGYIIDNPWNVSLDRAWAAGLILADTLINRNLGQRPVTLVGFSLGSRVIFSCLVELCKRKAMGLVENVFIFGTPLVRNKRNLVMARSVVSGRFVNGYSDKDWVLAYLFRATAGGFSTVMGISPIEGVEGIENFNCTDIVDGHMAYRKSMPKLMKLLGISVTSEEFVEIEENVGTTNIEKQRKLIHDVDIAQQKLLLKKKKKNSWLPKWAKPKKTKWQSMVEEQVVVEGSEIEINPGNSSGNKIVKDNNKKKEKEEGESKGEDGEENKKDPAIVDQSALMLEVKRIKAAMREDLLRHEAEIRENEDKKQEIIVKSSDDSNNSEDKNDNNSIRTPSSNHFQLMGAGRPILLKDNKDEEDEIKGGHKDVKYEFPDDI